MPVKIRVSSGLADLSDASPSGVTSREPRERGSQVKQHSILCRRAIIGAVTAEELQGRLTHCTHSASQQTSQNNTCNTEKRMRESAQRGGSTTYSLRAFKWVEATIRKECTMPKIQRDDKSREKSLRGGQIRVRAKGNTNNTSE